MMGCYKCLLASGLRTRKAARTSESYPPVMTEERRTHGQRCPHTSLVEHLRVAGVTKVHIEVAVIRRRPGVVCNAEVEWVGANGRESVKPCLKTRLSDLLGREKKTELQKPVDDMKANCGSPDAHCSIHKDSTHALDLSCVRDVPCHASGKERMLISTRSASVYFRTLGAMLSVPVANARGVSALTTSTMADAIAGRRARIEERVIADIFRCNLGGFLHCGR
jgi:hypothetical protein